MFYGRVVVPKREGTDHIRRSDLREHGAMLQVDVGVPDGPPQLCQGLTAAGLTQLTGSRSEQRLRSPYSARKATVICRCHLGDPPEALEVADL